MLLQGLHKRPRDKCGELTRRKRHTTIDRLPRRKKKEIKRNWKASRMRSEGHSLNLGICPCLYLSFVLLKNLAF